MGPPLRSSSLLSSPPPFSSLLFSSFLFSSLLFSSLLFSFLLFSFFSSLLFSSLLFSSLLFSSLLFSSLLSPSPNDGRQARAGRGVGQGSRAEHQLQAAEDLAQVAGHSQTAPPRQDQRRVRAPPVRGGRDAAAEGGGHH